MSKQPSTRLDIYVNYPGHCEEAFRFYEQHIGGKIISMMKHGDLPPNPNIPDHWKNAILHARMGIGDTVLMGADIPNAEPMRSAYLTLRFATAEETERVYAPRALSVSLSFFVCFRYFLVLLTSWFLSSGSMSSGMSSGQISGVLRILDAYLEAPCFLLTRSAYKTPMTTEIDIMIIDNHNSLLLPM